MNSLVPVNFRGDTLFAVERDEGIFVAIKPIVQALGVDWKAQHRRLAADPILSKGMVTTTIPSPGGAQETTCLRLDLVNGWLFTIDESRVKDEETRQKVLAYKEQCYSALFEHFYGKAKGATQISETDLRVFGGIMKAVFKKQIEDAIQVRLPALVALAVAADSRVSVESLVSVRQLLDEAKAEQRGRRSLNGRVGYRLRELALAGGVTVKRCAHSRVWLFPVEFARKFMRETGLEWVRAHNDTVRGQGRLTLVKPRSEHRPAV